MPNHYTTHQLAELLNIEHRTLAKQLERDAKKPRNQRKYPDARKCECGRGWIIPAKDLAVNNRKRADDE